MEKKKRIIVISITSLVAMVIEVFFLKGTQVIKGTPLKLPFGHSRYWNILNGALIAPLLWAILSPQEKWESKFISYLLLNILIGALTSWMAIGESLEGLIILIDGVGFGLFLILKGNGFMLKYFSAFWIIPVLLFPFPYSCVITSLFLLIYKLKSKVKIAEGSEEEAEETEEEEEEEQRIYMDIWKSHYEPPHSSLISPL